MEIAVAGRVPPRGARRDIGADAGSGDPADKGADTDVAGRVPPRGARRDIGADAGSGDPADKGADTDVAGRVPPRGAYSIATDNLQMHGTPRVGENAPDHPTAPSF